MKKIILFILFLIISSSAWATTWYVRDGGGTPTQCTGTTNAVYPGSGTSRPCALNHPRWIFGWDYDNPQDGVINGGDTVYINGDSDLNSGQQAQYLIGYDDTGANTTPDCNMAYPYDCALFNIPGGTDASHPTSIIGTGSHKPQLWGNERVYQVLDAENNYITIQNLEVTSHSSCGMGFGVNPCNYGGPFPYGAWAEDGIVVGGGTGLILTDIYLHSIKRYGIIEKNSLGTAVFTRLWLIGNGQGGFSTDPNTGTIGSIIWNQPIVEWSGCEEAYPLTYPGIDNPLNYFNCSAQDGIDPAGDYPILADGIDFGGSVGGITAGSWSLYGPGSISFNTKGGMDTYHSNNTGNMFIDKIRFEGNAGQALKTSAETTTVTNSVFIQDCGWWNGSPQAISGGMSTRGSGVCRATGNAFSISMIAGAGTTFNFYNNTIGVNNGQTIFLEINACDSSDTFNIKNNIVNGGYEYLDDTSWNSGGGNALAAYIYASGSDGNGAGCTNLSVNEDYNIVDNTKGGNSGCNGSHDLCGTSPGFISGNFPSGTSGGAANTYYQGTTGLTLVPISSTSAARGAGVSGLPYWNNSNDYYNTARPPISIGGIEYQSCAVLNYGCQYGSDCCGGTCTNNVCSGSCSSNGSSCTTGSTCCSGLCQSLSCVACLNNSSSCSSNVSCCSGICNAGFCSASSCTANGGACTIGATCCSTLCQNSLCVNCESTGGSCSTGSNCCSGICCSGSCSLSCGGSPSIVTQLTGKCSTSGKIGF